MSLLHRFAPSLPLVACLVVALGVRLVGLDRGATDFVPAGHGVQGAAFYHFHPDERTVLETALAPYDPFAPAATAYGPLNFYLVRAALGLASVAGWGAVGGTKPVTAVGEFTMFPSRPRAIPKGRPCNPISS